MACLRNPSLSLGTPEAVWVLGSSLVSQVSIEGLVLPGILRAALYPLGPTKSFETAKLVENNQPSAREDSVLLDTINIIIKPEEGTNY